jgi:hypothetical protein
MAHQDWSKSVYAAARAREAANAALDELKNFYPRYVTRKHLALHLSIGALGLALIAYWLYVLATSWESASFLTAFVFPFAGAVLLVFARAKYKAFSERRRLWNESGKDAVERELNEMRALAAGLPADPTAEEAAPVLRREAPEVLSEIAFQGQHFRAFTYLDFVLFPKLKNPVEQSELPERHSLHRDAYYVGEIVYDSWRTFHRDRRDIIDPRFVGSGGRRGVI